VRILWLHFTALRAIMIYTFPNRLNASLVFAFVAAAPTMAYLLKLQQGSEATTEQ